MQFLSNNACLQSLTAEKPSNTKKSSSDYLGTVLGELKAHLLYFVLGFVVSSAFLVSTYLLVNLLEEASSPAGHRPLGQHKLGVVVPFRDRFNELATFVPHISRFLHRQSIDFEIYVVNQLDELRFNRASLINVGFLAAVRDGCDYMAMHDVDLLPLNDLLNYSYPGSGDRPFHVSASGLHPDYAYATFIGGILLVSKQHFLRTNGMSNNYWGWGKEDDEFYLRLKEANLTVSRPDLGKFKSGRSSTFLHNHDAVARPRDKKRFSKQKSASLRKDDSGLDSVQYRVLDTTTLAFGQYRCQLLNVQLFCNKQVTHWCDYKYQFL